MEPRIITSRLLISLGFFLLIAVVNPAYGEESRESLSELEITAAQADGHPIVIELCVSNQLLPNRRCEWTAEDGKALFKGLPDGTYQVDLNFLDVWMAPSREVEMSGGERQAIQVELTPRVDFESLDQDYSTYWRVDLKWQSGWGPGGTIRVTSRLNGAVARWQSPRPSEEPVEIELGAEESEKFLKVLKEAQIFGGGKYAGIDTMGVDGPFNLLTVRNGAAAAVLVTAGNPSFAWGARRELLELLAGFRERMDRR